MNKKKMKGRKGKEWRVGEEKGRGGRFSSLSFLSLLK